VMIEMPPLSAFFALRPSSARAFGSFPLAMALEPVSSDFQCSLPLTRARA
jgi:hypothetical protein